MRAQNYPIMHVISGLKLEFLNDVRQFCKVTRFAKNPMQLILYSRDSFLSQMPMENPTGPSPEWHCHSYRKTPYAQPHASSMSMQLWPMPPPPPTLLTQELEAKADTGTATTPPKKRCPGWPEDYVSRIIMPARKIGSIIDRKGG